MSKTIATRELVAWLDDTLQAPRFRDYSPNGLQVEGRAKVRYVIAGVTASEALLAVAAERGADAVLVHHGWFWKNEDPRVRGIRRTRLALALAHDLNLIAYHLPLDAHPEYGNNAQLARVLGFSPERDAAGSVRTVGPEGLIWLGRPAFDGAESDAQTLGDLARSVAVHLGRVPLVVGDPEMPVRRVAWCTGAAQGGLQEAIDAGADAYLTGEVSEPTVHLARESGRGFLAAGHHATERYGVQALGQALAAQFGIQVEFVDIDNPV